MQDYFSGMAVVQMETSVNIYLPPRALEIFRKVARHGVYLKVYTVLSVH
jgi:hypothetical protein